MNYNERDLQDYLIGEESINVGGIEVLLIGKEIDINGYRIDLLGIDNKNNVYVFELKKGIIDGNALSQVLNYMFYVKGFLELKDSYVFGVLIGSNINQYTYNAISLISNVMFIDISPTFTINNFHYKGILDLANEEVYKKQCDFKNIVYEYLEAKEDEKNE